MIRVRDVLLAALIGAALGWACAEFFTGGELPPVETDIRSMA